MFKVGDIVKLKPGAVIKTDGFLSLERVNNFLKKDLFVVTFVKDDGLIGLDDPHGYGFGSTYFFNHDNFIIHKSINSFNLEKPYSQLTKLEYAAIQIFAARDWDLSDEYRKNVIRSAKKLLEECNGSD